MRNCKVLLLLFWACTLLGLVGCGSPATTEAAIPRSTTPTLPAPGVVAATSHPLVASYSITAPVASTVTVEFGTSVFYGRSTGTKTVDVGGGPLQFLVAGMHPNTTYHMRARVDAGSGNVMLDSDHTFTTGALPTATFPLASATPAGLAKSGGVEVVSSTGTDVSAVVLDSDGSVVWYYYDPTLPAVYFANPLRQIPNGNFLINFSFDVREVDLAGNVVRKVDINQMNDALAAAGYPLVVSSMHHDVLRLSNGHWIVLVNENKDFQDLPGHPGNTTVLGDAIVDLDENNQPVWVWRAFDHLDINRQPFGFPDWTHSNALVYTADGNLLLSMRHQSWVLKIGYANGTGAGDVLWRLGPGGDFTLSPNDPAQWFYNQHYPVLLPASGSSLQMAIYDNGDSRPNASGQSCAVDSTCYSRAVMMSVNESTLTAQVTWQYFPNFFSFWGGSIDVLPNGDVEFDSSTVNSGFSQVMEVTGGSTPQVVWQMNPSNANFYRAYRVPSLYPGVSW